jgi:GntR family transcriptional regulator
MIRKSDYVVMNMRLSRPEGAPPIYAQVATLLRQRITNGDLSSGDKLPKELDLALELGISRVPVRQALAILAREGLVRRRHGVGTFVADVILKREVFRLQGVVGWSTSAGSTHRLISVKKVVPQAKVSGFFGLQHGQEVTRVVRSRSRDRMPFNYIVNFLPADVQDRIGRQDFGSHTMVDILRKRLKIRLGAVRQIIEAQPADPAVAGELGLATSAPVLYVETRIWRKNGTPLMFSQAYYRGDNSSYSIEVPA